MAFEDPSHYIRVRQPRLTAEAPLLHMSLAARVT